MRPKGWPALMVEKALRSGEVAYYWQPPRRDVKAGFPLSSVALGGDYGAAQSRANELNENLTAWRRGIIATADAAETVRKGTLSWLFDTYYESDAFCRLKPRTQEAYRRVIRRALRLKSKEGRALGEYAVKALSPLAADRIYQRLLESPRGEAVRVANFTVTVIKRAWRVVGRQYGQHFPSTNPWHDLEQRSRYQPKKAASRAEAYALSAALYGLGHPHLGLVPLVAYEWHQRPENILSGGLRWADIRPAERPGHVRLEHGKTGAEVWLPLDVEGRPMFPEIEAYLARLEPLGEAIVMTPGERGRPHPYSFDYAQRRAREAREAAGLAEHVTFDACRHGGMTELGDAEVTEAGIMALSGHRSPDAARRYIKRTERQRLAALRKRRQLIDQALKRQC